MESVQTKEVSDSLKALTKHKKRSNQNVVVQPVAVMTDNKNIEVPATPPTAPVTSATPDAKPATPVNQPEHDYEKRWKDLKTHYDKEVSELRSDKKLLETKLAEASAPKLALPKTKEEMEAYRKQYPEAMDVFQTLAIQTARQEANELTKALDEVKSFQAELKEKEAFKKLLDIHPDAMEIRSSEQFHTWYNEQPSVIQKILSESTDITAVAKQLTLYKLEVLGINPKAVKKEETKSILDASIGVDVKGKPEIISQKKIWTQTEINAICADYNTWLKYRVELDDAHREGRVDRTK